MDFIESVCVCVFRFCWQDRALLLKRANIQHPIRFREHHVIHIYIGMYLLRFRSEGVSRSNKTENDSVARTGLPWFVSVSMQTNATHECISAIHLLLIAIWHIVINKYGQQFKVQCKQKASLSHSIQHTSEATQFQKLPDFRVQFNKHMHIFTIKHSISIIIK